jgi:hypothetical protein
MRVSQGDARNIEPFEVFLALIFCILYIYIYCIYPLVYSTMVLCFTLRHLQEVLRSPVNFEIIYPYCVILRHKYDSGFLPPPLFHGEYRLLSRRILNLRKSTFM